VKERSYQKPYFVLCLLVQVGELCVAGPGLFTGYLRNPEATRAAFFLRERAGGADISQAPAGALKVDSFYRTGDLAQRLPDGNLVWVGRKDRQVGWLLTPYLQRQAWAL
jgi:non-ribosomal peptide synthetase component F